MTPASLRCCIRCKPICFLIDPEQGGLPLSDYPGLEAELVPILDQADADGQITPDLARQAAQTFLRFGRPDVCAELTLEITTMVIDQGRQPTAGMANMLGQTMALRAQSL